MSNRLTFSLASLIVLITLGLVFTPTLAVADNGGVGAGNNHNPTGHDDDQTVANNHETSNPGHKHPKPTIKLPAAAGQVFGTAIKIAADDGSAANGVEDEFTLTVEFDMPVSSANNHQVFATTSNLDGIVDFQVVAQEDDGDLIGNVFDSAVVTRVVTADKNGSKFSVVFNVHANAIPDAATAGQEITHIQIGVLANRDIFGLAADPATNGHENLRSDFISFTLIPTTPASNQKPVVNPPTAPSTASTGTATVTYTVADADGDNVTVAAALDAASVTAGYTVGTATTTSVTITQPVPTAAMRTVPARTVVLTLTPTDDDATTPLDGDPVNVNVDFAEVSNAAPTLTISTAAPSAAVTDGSFDVAFTTADADTGDTVTVAAAISVDPSTAAASYSAPTSPAANSITITQTAPTPTAMITPAGTVTLELTPSDALGAGTPKTLDVEFAEVKFIPAAPTGVTSDIVLHSVASDDRAVKVELKWTASAGATGYEITQTGKANATYPSTGTITDPEFTTPVLVAGSYDFTVKAIGTHGTSPASSAAMGPGGSAGITVNPPPFFDSTSAKLSDSLGPVKDNMIQIWKGQTYTTTALPKARDTEGDQIKYTINGTQASSTTAFVDTLSLPAGFGLYHDDTENRFIAVRAADKGMTVAGNTTLYLYAYDPGSTPIVYSKPIAFSINVKDPIKPAKPTNVMAAEEGFVADPTTRTVNTNQVTVTWTAPVDPTENMDHDPSIPFGDPVDGYIVQWYDAETGSMAGKTPKHNADGTVHIPANATEYTTSVSDMSGTLQRLTDGITPLGKYQFEVIAFNGVANSDPSEQTTDSEAWIADPPGVPRDLRAALDKDDNTAVTLDWLVPRTASNDIDDGGRAISGHVVSVTLDGEEETQEADENTTHKLEDLEGGQYVFRVAAYNADGVGLKSEGTEFVFALPTDPSNIPPTFGTNTIAKISATAGTAIAQILPAATDPDGNDNDIKYSLGETPALPDGVTFTDSTRLLAGTPTAAMSAKAYTYTATDSANATASLNFIIEVMAGPAPPPNNAPTFGNASIASITATVDTPITSVTLPAATDPDGDSISYTVLDKDGEEELPAGLEFNKTSRYLSGTPSEAMDATDYTYVASDGKGGTARLNFAVEVKAAPTTPTDPDPVATYDPATKTTTIGQETIAANGFFVIPASALPDLELFFSAGGTITLMDPASAAAKSVVISEILWGLDLGEPRATQKNKQFVELYNTNITGAVDLAGWKLVFKEGRPAPANDVDQVSNVAGAGWVVDIGKSGRVTGTTLFGGTAVPEELVSMYRNINYAKVQNSGDAKRLEGVPGGNAKGSWKASTRVTTQTNIKSSPGRRHFVPVSVITATPVPRSPFVINEIGNDTGGTNDWVELRNVTDSEQSLKNYQLSVVTSDKKDTQLFHFHDKDYKVPAKGVILVASTSPENTDIAAGKDVARSANDQNPTGADALYVVRSFDLPDSGKTLLILRKSAKSHEKQHLGTDKDIIDVTGTLSISDVDLATSLWPLKATGAPHGNAIDGTGDEDFRAGKVYQRNDAGGGTGEKDLAVRGYTGIGYDRVAGKSAVNGGTPGYDNGALKEKIADLSNAAVSISEIMLDVGTGRQRLPQWIELYNSSMIHGVNLNGWKLSIENASDVDTALNATITLGAYTIAPNQTVLIVTTNGRMSDVDHFPATRVINLWTTKAYRDALQMQDRTGQVFSTTGFYFELLDKDNKLVDEGGNLDGSRRTRDDAAWAFPMSDDDRRSSLVRVYNRGAESDGTMADGWISADRTNFAYAISDIYYGDPGDFGTPGFRSGGPLPVSLSKFRPERLDDGSIVVRWITESELNNAGFNILRSDARDGEYTKLNTQLIEGKGTTSERTTYEWKDTSAKPNVVYYYQIQDVSLDGKVTTLRVSRLKGHISTVGKATMTWGEIKALQ